MWAGRPAKLLRKMEEGEAEFILRSADNYAILAALHAEENAKTFPELEADKARRRWQRCDMLAAVFSAILDSPSRAGDTVLTLPSHVRAVGGGTATAPLQLLPGIARQAFHCNLWPVPSRQLHAAAADGVMCGAAGTVRCAIPTTTVTWASSETRRPGRSSQWRSTLERCHRGTLD